jgi:ABC-type sugar transport system permease subunit
MTTRDVPGEERVDGVVARLRAALGRETGERTSPWWYAIVFPKVLVLTLFLGVPFVAAIAISFFEWSPLASTHPFVGLENYQTLLTDPVFHNSIINTVTYSASLLLIDVPIALGLAILLDMNLRGTKVYSTAIFLPVVTSWVVVSLIWSWIYNPNFGALNLFFGWVGLPTLDWLRNTDTALAAIIAMSIWKHVGFNMVIFLAGLKGIPNTFHEAATMDGASRWERFRYVTLPLLRPTTFLVVILTMIFSFRFFTQVYVMTGGGPVQSSYSIMFYFYELGFSKFNMGLASAVGVILFVGVFALSLLQNRYFDDDVDY